MSPSPLVVLLLCPILLACPQEAQEPANPGLERQIRSLQQQLQQPAGVAARVRLLLSRVRDSRSPWTHAVEVLLAQESGADELLRQAATANKSTRQRRTALAALLRRGGSARTFALRRAVLDRPTVLQHLVALTRQRGETEAAVRVLAEDLKQGSFHRRRRTATALAELGDPKAVPHLVAARRALAPSRRCRCRCRRHRPRRRAHVAVITQTAVVRNFRTEIA